MKRTVRIIISGLILILFSGHVFGQVYKYDLEKINIKPEIIILTVLFIPDLPFIFLTHLSFEHIVNNIAKPNPETTIFTKASFSQSKDKTNDLTEASYKEMVLGLAYRPIHYDWINILSKYTYLEDDSPSGQTDIQNLEEERAHTFETEAVFDLTDTLQLVEKFAYKHQERKITGFNFAKSQSYLTSHRLNYKLDQDWQASIEYRRLHTRQTEDTKQGGLIELSRKIGDLIQASVGYNFAEFESDLTELESRAHGPYFRLDTTLYDRTPEEKQRAQQLALDKSISQILKTRLKERFQQKQSQEAQEIIALYEQANQLFAQDELLAAEDKYKETLLLITQMELDEKVKIDDRLNEEDKIKGLFAEANLLYQKGKLNQALEYYSQCVQKIDELEK